VLPNLRKNPTFCHSERGEESLLLFLLALTIEERLFASLRMTREKLFGALFSLCDFRPCGDQKTLRVLALQE
jgi:hypothetical protein